MPNKETFQIPPIARFIHRHLASATTSVDPFARNADLADYTNDLNPNTTADHHMQAVDFLQMLNVRGVRCDLVLFDPPYSPRQIKECYKAAGIETDRQATQESKLASQVRRELSQLLMVGGVVLSFGWNSNEMHSGYCLEELLLVNHGGGHNDTICMAERKVQGALFD